MTHDKVPNISSLYLFISIRYFAANSTNCHGEMKEMGELASIDFSTSIYLFKVNNGNTRTMYDNYSKLIIKSTERTERQHCRRYDALFSICEKICEL